MADVKKIEQHLDDLDNLIDTNHFPKESVGDYTFYQGDITLKEFVSKSREYIRQLSIIHKGIADERPNEVTEALPLYIVRLSLLDLDKIKQQAKAYAEQYKTQASIEGLENIADDFQNGVRWALAFLRNEA